MISYEEAKKKAIDFYGEGSKIYCGFDSGAYWAFTKLKAEVRYENPIIVGINKRTGEIAHYYLPSKEGFKLISGKLIERNE